MHEQLHDSLEASPKLFADETTVRCSIQGIVELRPASSSPMLGTIDRGAAMSCLVPSGAGMPVLSAFALDLRPLAS